MYATVTMLAARMPEPQLLQLADDTRQAAGLGDPAVTPVLEALLEQASREIDGWIGSRYSVPLQDPPELLRDVCARMALYHLYLRSRVAGKAEVMELRERDYARCVEFLKSVAAGRASLGVPEKSVGAAHAAGGVRARTSDRKFGGLQGLR